MPPRAPAPAVPAPAKAPPPVRAGFGLRVLRAAPFATVCVVLAAAGHVFASGSPLPLPALLLGWLAVGAMAVCSAGRERSLRALCGALAVAQLGLHTLFHLSEYGGSGSPGMTAMAGMAGMADMPGMAAAPPPAATAAPHAVLWWHAVLLGMTPQMLGAHVLAALAAGWWLRRGEAAIWRLVRVSAKAAEAAGRACAAALNGLRLLAAAALGTPLAPSGHPLPAGADDGRLRRPAPLLLRHSVIRRGPPTGATS